MVSSIVIVSVSVELLVSWPCGMSGSGDVWLWGCRVIVGVREVSLRPKGLPKTLTLGSEVDFLESSMQPRGIDCVPPQTRGTGHCLWGSWNRAYVAYLKSRGMAYFGLPLVEPGLG